VARSLGDHSALAFTCVQGLEKFSSPKYHAQPVGEPVEVSENCIVNGAVPDMGAPVKLATGAAHTGLEITTNIIKISSDMFFILIFSIQISNEFFIK
jgi:hypothetical protein